MQKEKHWIVGLDELTKAQVNCQTKECPGSLILHLNTGERRPDTKCPICRQTVAAGLFPVLDAWYNFIEQAKGLKIQFRLRQE